MLTEENMERIANAGRNEDHLVMIDGEVWEVEIKTDADGDDYASATIPKKYRNGFYVEELENGTVVSVTRPTHVAVYF